MLHTLTADWSEAIETDADATKLSVRWYEFLFVSPLQKEGWLMSKAAEVIFPATRPRISVPVRTGYLQGQIAHACGQLALLSGLRPGIQIAHKQTVLQVLPKGSIRPLNHQSSVLCYLAA